MLRSGLCSLVPRDQRLSRFVPTAYQSPADSDRQRFPIRRAKFGYKLISNSCRMPAYRKYARLKRSFAGVFEQAGIALAAHNLVIDAARFLARAHLADENAGCRPRLRIQLSKLVQEWKEVRALQGRVPYRCGRFGSTCVVATCENQSSHRSLLT